MAIGLMAFLKENSEIYWLLFTSSRNIDRSQGYSWFFFKILRLPSLTARFLSNYPETLRICSRIWTLIMFGQNFNSDWNM